MFEMKINYELSISDRREKIAIEIKDWGTRTPGDGTGSDGVTRIEILADTLPGGLSQIAGALERSPSCLKL